jgi:hypothetical protein
MDNYFVSPKLSNDVHHRNMKACDTVRHDSKETLPNVSPRHLRLKKEDSVSSVWGNLPAVSEGQTLNMNVPAAENGKAVEATYHWRLYNACWLCRHE